MRGIFEKDPGRASAKFNYMLSPRVFQRRSVVLLAVLAVFGFGLLISSARLRERCEESGYCGFAQLSPSLAALGDPYRDHDQNNSMPAHAGKPAAANPEPSAGSECASFPDTSNVLLVMKTGASEAFGKIPNQLMTNLKCLPEFYLFGDMAQKVAGYTIHDSLDTVLPEVTRNNEDFDLYFRQKTCPVDQGSCNKHHDVGRQAWKLDKYKNIHMAEKTYAMRPDYDWYLFVDADTYVVWPTLLKWLEQLDPDEPHYIGSVAYVGYVPFAHGGSGYLVSQATMSKLFKGQDKVANRWDQRVTRECCGDFVFALALKNETDTDVRNAWPTINGEKPHTLPYAKKEWCQPIVTMHHAGAEEVSELYAFEKERDFSYPMRIKDLYHRFVKDQLMARRDDWDNLSDNVFYLNSSAYEYLDWEKKKAKTENLSALEMLAHESFDDCRRACHSLPECLQFRFYHGICAISHTIKHGHPTKQEPYQHWRFMSGWNVKRIEEWVEEHDDCGEVEFPIEDSWLSL
ncbi:glycosyltransferase family 31 protein [Hirsutella rhossiliensis]|uniref:N-acetylgalactosaminide beta-1,3-galactosyltransferase n=1 Tax=Hirsutella rhossiliensis TaxID=111463 RepID=A0A9P8MTH6_9HYPO|nr:glycosyltransferase family 31 protein [Hirsutella rhossiliensis]KAH0960787.1 glycosyltransferase family 31 protein [Hirsutella rhossiliensis]